MIDGAFALAGALTGFVVGLTGVGGGALMTPLLLLVFGVVPTTAIATDLWFAVVTKIVASAMHNKGGQVDWQVVRRLWTGSLPVAIGVVALMIHGAGIRKIEWLSNAIGITVLITAAGLFLAPRLLAIGRENRLAHPDRFKAVQPQLTVLAGALLGLCVALTSVGAGAIGSVMLLYLYPLRLTPHRLVATDIVHAVPLAFIAGLGYLFAGMVDVAMLASLLTGSIPAVIAGSLMARRSSSRALQLILAGILFVVGVQIIL